MRWFAFWRRSSLPPFVDLLESVICFNPSRPNCPALEWEGRVDRATLWFVGSRSRLQEIVINGRQSNGAGCLHLLHGLRETCPHDTVFHQAFGFGNAQLRGVLALAVGLHVPGFQPARRAASFFAIDG